MGDGGLMRAIADRVAQGKALADRRRNARKLRVCWLPRREAAKVRRGLLSNAGLREGAARGLSVGQCRCMARTVKPWEPKPRRAGRGGTVGLFDALMRPFGGGMIQNAGEAALVAHMARTVARAHKAED